MQRVLGAREAKLFTEIARLRYAVYCAERGYLSQSDYEDRQETDRYDDRSVHILAKSRDGAGVGTVRLVLGSASAEFPFEQHCSINPQFELPPRRQSAEVSRLIVSRSLRRFAGTQAPGAIMVDERIATGAAIAPRADRPPIARELFRALYRYSIGNGIRYWYAAMEQSLARFLGRMGFRFVPIGPEGDYYGPVTTYVGDLRVLEVQLRQSDEAALAWFRDAPVGDGLRIKTLLAFDAPARATGRRPASKAEFTKAFAPRPSSGGTLARGKVVTGLA